MMFAQAQSPVGLSDRNLLCENDTTWGKRKDNFADGDGWSQISLDSSDVKNAVSPFDDIGFLATRGVHGNSYKITESTNTVRQETNGNAPEIKGASLYDFLANNATTEPTRQAQHEKKIEDELHRKRRGMLLKSGSKRGDLMNVNDEESIGLSTIASKMTKVGKGKTMLELSKGSLALSVLGANRSKSLSKSTRGNKSGSSDPSAHSKNSFSAFGTSMFSRDSSKSKERMREMIEQLEGANKTLLTENADLCSKLLELSVNVEHTSHIQCWLSVEELTLVTTDLCKYRAMYESTMRTCEQLQRQIERSNKTMEENSKRIQELDAANIVKDDRIAYLEGKLLGNAVCRANSHSSLNEASSQGAMVESCSSFASFGFGDEEFDNGFYEGASYEEALKIDGESTVAESTAREERKEMSEESNDNKREEDDYVEEDENRDTLGQALKTISKCGDRQSLETLVELAEDIDSYFSGEGTKQSNESTRNKPSQPNSLLTLDRKWSDESSELVIQPSSWCTMDIDGFKTSRRAATATTGMPLESFLNNYKKPELNSTEKQEAIETGTWAVSDIISIQKERTTGVSDFLLSSSDLPLPPPPPPSMRNFTDPGPLTRKKGRVNDRTRVNKVPSEAPYEKRSGTKDLCSTNISGPASCPTPDSNERSPRPEVLAPAPQPVSTPLIGPVISTSRIVEKPRRSRSTSIGRKRALSGDRSKKRMTAQSDHGSCNKGRAQTPDIPYLPRNDVQVAQSEKVRGIGRSASNGRAGSNPTTLTKQASRRRLGSIQDPLESSQHSSKSNGGHRRPSGPTSDQIGASSSHSSKSAGRRRLRCSVTGEKDRRAVSEALDRLVGSEESMNSVVPDESESMPVPPQQPSSKGDTPSSRLGKLSTASKDKCTAKRSNFRNTLSRTYTDPSELVSSAQIRNNDDNAKPRISRHQSGSVMPVRKSKSAPMA
jgi:hypothetical protein